MNNSHTYINHTASSELKSTQNTFREYSIISAQVDVLSNKYMQINEYKIISIDKATYITNNLEDSLDLTMLLKPTQTKSSSSHTL